MNKWASLHIAVLLPCYNEELSIADVVTGFKQQLPKATVYVFDNNSTDKTAEKVATAGAIVKNEPLVGKGHVVRRMFADVEADIYIMADGDGTYNTKDAPAMIDMLVKDNLDMVAGRRIPEAGAYRPNHEWGNSLFNGVVALLFGKRLTDIFSGYRVFSRRFVKSFPSLSTGFETETELSIHALELDMPVAEVDTTYSARQEGSTSKLCTYCDGLRILKSIVWLFKDAQPLKFFSSFFVLFSILSLGLGLPVVTEFLETGIVARFPTAFLAASLGILGFVSLTCGLVLDSIALSRKEAKRMFYLRQKSVHHMLTSKAEKH